MGLNRILDRARKGEPLSVTHTQRCYPTNAANLAQHIVENIQYETVCQGISHFTDRVPMIWHGFAGSIAKIEGLLNEWYPQKVKNYHTFAVRPENSIL